MLTAFLAAAVTTAPLNKLGPFTSGQTFSEASAAAALTGLRLQPFQHTGRYAGYSIWQGQSDLKGFVGFCDGKVQTVSINVSSYDDFTQLLREKIAEWGQPQTSVETEDFADGSRTVETMNFRWPARRYRLQIGARRPDETIPSQELGEGLKCP